MARADESGEAREFRLEGFSLWFAGGLLVAALVGAFVLGRWVGAAGVEATSAPATGAAAVVPEEAAEDLTFFDTLSGPEKQAEPRREATAAARPATPAPAAPAAPAASPGPWFVQIGALRDRQAAAALVRSLEGQGYAVRVATEREGARGVLFKVRVGGFPAREAADAAAIKLRAGGQGGAFVTRVD
jgi:cell division septation protein DedD